MIATSGILGLLFVVVLAGLFFWCCVWFIGFIGLPEPFAMVARVILALFALAFLFDLLMRSGGHPLFRY